MMTWNDHVRHQREAFEFMGLAAPPARLAFDFVPAPPAKVQRCRRPELPAVPYPEHQRARPGRPYSMFVRTPLSPAEKAYKPIADAILREFEDLRPIDPPDDCRPGMPKAIRPCPWAGCRHHLGITVNDSGSIKVDHGHLDFERLEETCSIDVAQRGKHTQKQVARWVGLQEDWLRKTEVELRAQLLRKVRRQAPLSDWGPPDADGRQTCLNCHGEGDIDDVECGTCDGEGYRWERRSLPGAKPRSLGTKAIPRELAAEARRDLRRLAAAGYYEQLPSGEFRPGRLFPKIYGDCEREVPRTLEDGSKGWCPFVSCRMHLKYDVDQVTGALKDMFPGRQPWEMDHTCALRFVEDQPPDQDSSDDAAQTLAKVGLALNLTPESVRLTADEAMAKVRRREKRMGRAEVSGDVEDDDGNGRWDG